MIDPTTRFKLYIIALYHEVEQTRVRAGVELIEDGELVSRMARDSELPEGVQIEAAKESIVKLIRESPCDDPHEVLREVMRTVETLRFREAMDLEIVNAVREAIIKVYGEGLLDEEKKIETIVHFAKFEFKPLNVWPGMMECRTLVKKGTINALREIAPKLEEEIRSRREMQQDTSSNEMRERLVELGKGRHNSSTERHRRDRKVKAGNLSNG